MANSSGRIGVIPILDRRSIYAEALAKTDLLGGSLLVGEPIHDGRPDGVYAE